MTTRSRFVVFLTCAVLAGSSHAADFSSWSKRVPITFSGYDRLETLTNFPALIMLGTNISGFSYADFLSGTNGDLRFADATDGSELNYEIDTWDTNGISTVWVQIPRLTNGAAIMAYWGLAGQPIPAYSTNGLAWDSNYKCVMHLREASGTRYDSTANRNTGAPTGTITKPSGVAGVADRYHYTDGDDYVAINDSASMQNVQENNYTLEAWCQPLSVPPGTGAANDAHYGILMKTGYHTGLRYTSTTNFACDHWLSGPTGDGAGSSVLSAAGTFYHVACAIDRVAGRTSIYVNGALTGTGTFTPNATAYEYGTTPWRLGIANPGAASYRWSADIVEDETRISAIARSSNWVWASWATVASNRGFAVYGSVGVPSLRNDPVSGVAGDAATLNGTLTATGQAVSAVSVYWGANDAGGGSAGWGNTNVFGVRDLGPLSTNATGLATNTLYFYRYYATNDYGETWASPAEPWITGELALRVTDGAASESGPDAATFQVVRPEWATGCALRVNYTLGGTAVNGVDYTSLPGTVTIPQGATNAPITVTPIYDADYLEPTETVSVALAPGGYLIGGESAATATIANLQPSSVAFVSGGGSDTAGDGTLANPYRSLTRALTNPAPYTLIYAGDGTYDAADGEVFPLLATNGVSVVGTNAGAAVVDAGYATNALSLAAGASNNRIANLVFRRARGTAIVASDWQGALENCTITDVADGSAVGSACALYYYSSVGNRPVTLSGVAISNIVSSARFITRFDGAVNPAATLLITNCVFRGLTNTTAEVAKGGGPFYFNNYVNATIVDSTFDTLACAGADHEENGFVDLWQATLTIDRCVFRNIDTTRSGGRTSIIGVNRGNGYVYNSLFQNINSSTARSCIGGFRSNPYVRNCTFDTVTSAFLPAGREGNNYIRAYNCIVSYTTNLTPTYGTFLFLFNCDLFNTGLGNGYNVGSDQVFNLDPWYKSRATGNYRLRTFSPLVDLGSNAYVSGTADLDRTARQQDGDADGAAVVDLGAYEVDFLNPPNARFKTDKPVYPMFSGSRSLPVYIQPTPAPDVEAGIAYGTNLSGDAGLAFLTGTETDTLHFAITQPLTVSNGALTYLSICESNTARGVETGEVGLYVYDAVATIASPTRQFVRAGTTNTIRVQLPSSSLRAPGPINITVGAPGGAGGNGLTWVGGTSITNGGWQSDGSLQVVGGAGENTVDLSLDNSFQFLETGSSNLTFHVVGYTSPLYVSNSGNDVAGDGSAGNPLKTIGYAISVAAPGDEVRLFPGVYGTNTGETLPLQPGSVKVVGYDAAGAWSPTNHVLNGQGAVNAFYFNQTSVTGYLANVTVSNTAQAAIYLDQGRAVISNCVVRDTTIAGSAYPAAAQLMNNSRLTALDCLFQNLNAKGVIGEEYASLFIDNNNFWATNCAFLGNVSTYGTCYSPENAVQGRFFLTKCLFQGNRTPAGKPHDSYRGIGVYEFQGGANSSILIDRCRFLDNTNGAILGISYQPSASTVKNSLFADNQCEAMLSGYTCGALIDSCTFVSNSGIFDDHGPSYNVTFRNCIIATNRTAIGTSLYVRFRDTLLYQSDPGYYDGANSSNLVTGVDPNLKPNWALRAGSPAIDAGNNAWMSDPYDLAGTDRKIDGDLNGSTNVDFGAYEFNPNDTNTLRFATPLPSYKLYSGQSLSVPVWVSPAPGGAVQGGVTYPADITGAGLLDYPSGTETNTLVLTAAGTLSVSNGTLVTVTVSETNTSRGVQAADIGVRLYQRKVYLSPSPARQRLFIRAGETNLIGVQLENASLEAPADLTVTLNSVGGAGTHGVSWVGSNVITNGGWQTAGALQVVGGAGVNTVDLSVDSGFRFGETADAHVTLEVVALASPLYADAAAGNDQTGLGTAVSPLQTLTYGASLLRPGEELRLFPGTYSTNKGEIFPIQPGGARVVGYDPVGPWSAATHVIDGSGRAVNLFRYYQTGTNGYLANLTFTNVTATAVYLDQSSVTLSNCAARALSTGGNPGGVWLWNNSQLVALDCAFAGLNGKGAIGVEPGTVANNNNNVWATNCTFVGNYSTCGTLYGYANVAGRFFLTQCTWASNNVPNAGVQDSYASSGVYIWGSGSYPSWLQIDRCRFVDNTNGVLFGISYIGVANVTLKNSLFVGNKCNWDMLYGWSWGATIVNCTFVRNKGTLSGRDANSGNVYLRNSLMSSNDTAVGGGNAAYLNIQTSLVWQASLGLYSVGGSSGIITNADPRLRADYVPLAGSPAMDAGNNAWMTDSLDLAGNPRIHYKVGIVDLGAFEIIPPPKGSVFIVR